MRPVSTRHWTASVWKVIAGLAQLYRKRTLDFIAFRDRCRRPQTPRRGGNSVVTIASRASAALLR
jgi:hypothetical protein